MMTASTWIFVVDTNQYSGNFERQLCAYMTGHIGDCEVGDSERAVFNQEMSIPDDMDTYDEQHPFHFVIREPDDRGCYRGCYHPCAIWPTPGWFNNGMGGEYLDVPENEAPAKEDHRRKWLAEIREGDTAAKIAHCREMADSPLSKFPAYHSVAIFMERRPTADEVKILIERARKYPGGEYKPTITGFRLIRRDVIETEEPLEQQR